MDLAKKTGPSKQERSIGSVAARSKEDRKNVKGILNALPADLRKMMTRKKMKEIRELLGAEVENIPNAVIVVACLVGGILDLSKYAPEEAEKKLLLLAAVIGGTATAAVKGAVQSDAFQKKFPNTKLPVSDDLAIVIGILDKMPSKKKVEAVRAMLELNPNLYYGLVVPSEADEAGVLKAVEGWKSAGLQSRVRVSVAVAERNGTTVRAMFDSFKTAAAKNKKFVRALGEDFVLTGSQASLAGIDGLPAAMIETDADTETIPEEVLDVAGTAVSVSFAQERLRGEEFDEKTNTAIQRKGSRYGFRLAGLQALFAQIAADIQGLFSLRKAA